MRRRSEICQFKFEDLQHHGNHKHALLLRHSKTDQYNQGRIIPISNELSEMISSWSLAIDQDNGYILRSFKRNLSTDLLDKNTPLEKIMLRGGWKSETSAMRYLQSWGDSNW